MQSCKYRLLVVEYMYTLITKGVLVIDYITMVLPGY